MVAEATLLDRVFRVLADSPKPEDILALQTTDAENARLDYLEARKRDGTLTVEEIVEIEKYLDAERYVRLAKARAFANVKSYGNA